MNDDFVYNTYVIAIDEDYRDLLLMTRTPPESFLDMPIDDEPDAD